MRDFRCRISNTSGQPWIVHPDKRVRLRFFELGGMHFQRTLRATLSDDMDRPHRQRWQAGMVAMVVIAQAGCGGGSTLASHPTQASRPTTTTIRAAIPPPTDPTSTVPDNATSTTQAPNPTLGQLAGDFVHGSGFGQPMPSDISNGGGPDRFSGRHHVEFLGWPNCNGRWNE